MKKLHILTFLFSLAACQAPQESKSEKKEEVKAQTTKKVSPQKKVVSIDSMWMDESEISSNEYKVYQPSAVVINLAPERYSEKFVNGLVKQPYDTIVLMEDFMVMGGQDTISFPSIPELNKSVQLVGKKENKAVMIRVLRLNNTSIKYHIELVEFGNSSIEEDGIAELNTSFYLGSEIDISDYSGTAYDATEYTNYKEGDCYTIIRLGYDEDSGGLMLGKFIKNCNNDIDDITLDYFPTLIEK